MKFTEEDYDKLNQRLWVLEGSKRGLRATHLGDETVRLCITYDIRPYGGVTYAEADYNHSASGYLHCTEMVEHHCNDTAMAYRVAVVRAAIKVLEARSTVL